MGRRYTGINQNKTTRFEGSFRRTFRRARINDASSNRYIKIMHGKDFDIHRRIPDS